MKGTNKRDKSAPVASNGLSAAKCAERLKAVADPDRLRIVDCLRVGALAVGDVCELLEMDMARTSHHLGVLRSNDIVRVEKQGRHRYYSLNPELVADLKAKSLNFGCCRLELAETWKPDCGQ